MMLILITYDVSTKDKAGQRRLRRIAKLCLDFGQRVQNSVFECELDNVQWLNLKASLLSEMDKEKDSLRFYRLGKDGKKKVEHIGAKPALDLDQPLIF